MFIVSGSKQRARISYDGHGRCSERACRRSATHIVCRSSGRVTDVRATCRDHALSEVFTGQGYAQFSIKIIVGGVS